MPKSNPRLALPLFLVLAFCLSWYPWALHAAGYPGNPNPNPLGLLLAALIAAAVSGGWRESIAILKSIVRVRVSPVLWLAVFAVPVGALAVAAAIAALFGTSVQPTSIDWSDVLDRFLVALLFVALGEEPAWRGFLQPVLQQRMSVLRATSCVAAIWAAWHAPLFGAEFAWQVVPAFLVSVVAATFVLAWLRNASRGSVLLPMLMHATVNTVGAGLVFHWVEDRVTHFWFIYAGVWAALALALTVLTGGSLAYQPENRSQRSSTSGAVPSTT